MFVSIACVVYSNRYRDGLYRKEDKNPTVTAMKFTNKGLNDRMYCREIEYDGGKKVIICEIHIGKKSQKNQQAEKTAIKRTKEHELDIST